MSDHPAPTAPLETSTPMEEFLEKNFKKLLLGFTAAAVLVVVYGVLNHLSTTRNAEAAAAFASAKTVAVKSVCGACRESPT